MRRVKEPERGEHSEQARGRFERGRGDPGDEAGRGLGIVEEPGHQVSRAAAVEEVQGEALEVGVEPLLQVGDEQSSTRAPPAGAPRYAERAARQRDRERQQGQAEKPRRGDRAGTLASTNLRNSTQEPQVGGGGREQADRRDREQPRVVSAQAQEPDVRAQINGPER